MPQAPRLSPSHKTSLHHHHLSFPSVIQLKMAFAIRQPFRLTSTLGVVSKPIFKSATPIRLFHSSRPAANFFTSRTTTQSSQVLAKARNAFRSSRTYIQQPIAQPANNGNLVQKLALGGALFGGTLIASESSNITPLFSNWSGFGAVALLDSRAVSWE